MLLEASKSHADFHKYFKHIKNVNAFRKHDTIIFGKTRWTESTKKNYTLDQTSATLNTLTL